MDARTYIQNGLTSRRVAEAERSPRASRWALGPAARAVDGAAAEVFKMTPCVADLKPGGRYVAKDMFEAGDITLLMKNRREQGILYGDCCTGGTIAENLKSVKRNPRRDEARSVQKPVAAIDGAVGLTGSLALEGAIVDVAAMSSLGAARQTNHGSGARWRDAQQVGPAVAGAVTHPGGAHEKQCYADI